MKLTVIRKNNKTIFLTTNETLIRSLLEKSGVTNIAFVKNASNTTLHLNKPISDFQLGIYKSLVSEINKEPQEVKKEEHLSVINGFTGCLINGYVFEYKL